MADQLKPGRYKGKGIKGSEQFGEAGDNSTPQIAIDMTLKDTGGVTMTTFLFFSVAAAPYSFERLRAMGWKGQSAADLANLDGIDLNEVDCELRYEEFQGKTRAKLEILTGPSRVTLAKTVDKNAFAAKVAALLGSVAPAAAAVGGEPPPF